ncbi:ribonuclease P protein component [Bradyrhizobium sp. A5]|uniref:ribonuclease P protein component n=1 Tax=Bradyrhizobium sp. A5 TaxID=3133696 RepID=UPI00324A76FC
MDRLRQRADFLAVANGARVNSPAFVLQSLDRRQNLGRDDSGPIRIGFTVTKKNGNAPERNRIRRRLREMVKRLDPVSMQPHHDYVLVGRRDALSRDFATMLDDLRTALTKPSRQAYKGRGPRPGSSRVPSRPDPSRPDPGPAAAASRKPD